MSRLVKALKVLDDVREYNYSYGFDGAWIFQSSCAEYDYRLSYCAACSDINTRTVQRFAGHSDINTTMKFYSFERKSLEQQADAFDRSLSLDE